MLDSFQRRKKSSSSWILPTTKIKVDRPTLLGWFLLVCAALIWGASLRGVDPYKMDNLGLLSILGPAFYVALGILIVSVSLMIYQQKVSEYLFLMHTSLLIVIIHGTPPILYGTLRYSWAWKHVGVVDYIQRHGYVNPNERFLDAYHNWPGFFSLNALITEVGGLDSALSYAPWAQIFFNMVNMGALLLILKSCTKDRRLVWLGIWFFFLTNWVGQDYFSPQAMGFLLYLVVIGICLQWFASKLTLAEPAIKRWLRSDRLTALAHKTLDFRPTPATLGAELPLQRVGLMMIVVLGIITIASSHQITPALTIVAFLFLVIFRTTSIRSLPMLTIVVTAVWVLYVATVFLNSELESVVDSFGQVSENVESNLIELSVVSQEQQLVVLVGRLLTAGLLGLAGLGILRKLIQGDWNLPAALLALAPFPMLLGNAYGGEMIFRTYLFALPFMAFFAAALIIPNVSAGRSWWTPAISIVVSAVLLGGFLFGYYGKDRQYYFTEDEIKASEYLYKFAPPNSLLIEGTRNYPGQYQNYELFTYVPISRENPEVHQRMLADPANFFARWLGNSNYAEAYLLITRSHKIEIDMLGNMPAGALDTIEQALLESPRFRVVFQNSDARIFVLADDTSEDG